MKPQTRQNATTAPSAKSPPGAPAVPGRGKTATKYHTPRFVLIAALREHLEVLVPAHRGPGRPWKQGPAPAALPAQRSSKPIRIGYARTSTARQELASQLEALHAADCHKVFQEQISTRTKVRPELEAALKLARHFKEAAPDTPVIFTVHELKRLARRKDSLLDSLTSREREVLKLMAEGHDNATIARTLVVTERAVSKHIGNVFLKLGLPTGDSGHRRVLAELAYLDNR
ncbi:LuxR C-terminal-related transcriptional regulator [Streptomyces europaeiscabiei]|uniref:recombinase family protein n=1 Tax=Streptomyces europaeiscabiei TaxID=146819 RepID=UPI002D21B95A|nr:recombinase family protein [Streptomyces europaeiscabiei]